MREAIENIGKQMEAEARRAAQAQAMQGNQGGGIDPKTAAAIQKAQVEAQIKMQNAKLDQQLKIADTQQRMAIRDAEAAQKIRQNSLA